MTVRLKVLLETVQEERLTCAPVSVQVKDVCPWFTCIFTQVQMPDGEGPEYFSVLGPVEGVSLPNLGHRNCAFFFHHARPQIACLKVGALRSAYNTECAVHALAPSLRPRLNRSRFLRSASPGATRSITEAA